MSRDQPFAQEFTKDMGQQSQAPALVTVWCQLWLGRGHLQVLDHLQVLEDARQGTKTIVGDCSKTSSRYFLC